MTIQLSRRSLIGTATMSAALVSSREWAFAKAVQEPPIFGPAPDVALLSRNENPYGPAPSAVQAMAEAASKGCYYADGGLKRLTAMIAERFSLPADHVVVSSGSTEVLCAAALAWGEKGAILCPELFWDTTVQYGADKGGKVKRIALKPDMSLDLDAMAASVTPDVALVHVCNPNNPTGMVLDGDMLRAFVRKIGPKATVLVDEAYMELTDDPEYSSVAALVKEGQNLIVTRTFSKIYGMAGLRVGYALCSPDKAALLKTYLMSFGGNSAGLAAAIASYNDTTFTTFSRNRIVEARGIMLDAIRKAGLEVLPSQTNFLFVKVPDADKVQKAFASKNIMVRGTYGKWSHWSRVSTGKIEDVKRYAAALPEAVKV